MTEKAGVSRRGWWAGALFIDCDRDGLLDLIVSRYLKWDFGAHIWCGERRLAPGGL